MTDSLLNLITDEVTGSMSGLPPGSTSLFKLLFIGGGNNGGTNYSDVKATFYYNGNLVDVGELIRNENFELAEKIGSELKESRRRTIRERYPSLSKEEIKDIESEYIDRVANRIIENKNVSAEEKADAAVKLVSTFLHGTHQEKWEMMKPVLEDMESHNL